MTEPKRLCKGKKRSTGEPCRNRAFKDSDYCLFHGAQALGNKGGKGRPKGSPKPPGAGGPALGNTSGVKHGAYSSRLPPEERALFERHLEEYLADVPNPSATDRHALERLAILETKWQVAVTTGGTTADALDVLHRLLHRELKALQVTRESKDTARTSGTTPAEVMAALLMKVRERAALAPPQPVEAEVIDVEAVEVQEGGDGEE
jgi:hypothetical protein